MNQAPELPLSSNEELELPPKDSADLAQKLWQIKRSREEVESIKKQLAEAIAFYQRKIDSIEDREGYLTNQVETYLLANGLTKLATHNGTAFFQKRTVVSWPTYEKLLEWVKTLPEEAQSSIIQTHTSVDMKALKKYVDESKAVPEGYFEQEVSNLQLRGVSPE